MKILHVIFRMCTGGTEMMLIDIVRCQAAEGHDVAVMIINEGSDPALVNSFPPDVKVCQLNRREGSRSPLPILRFNLMLMALNPAAIHVHNERAVNMMIPPLRRRVLQTLHTTGIRLHGCQTRTPLASISQWVASELKQRQKLDSSVVYNGIYPDSIARRKHTPQLRELVCVGRLDQKIKGQDLLIRALAYSSLAYPHIADYNLTLIGGGPDEESLKKLAASLGIASRVKFLGAMSRSEIYSLLPSFDLFVLPSRQEGFGLVLAEAMAAGLPVIASNLPGPLEIMKGGRFGLSFQAGSAVSLAEALEKAAVKWKAFQEQASGPALKFVKANFDVRNTARNYVSLYSAL